MFQCWWKPAFEVVGDKRGLGGGGEAEMGEAAAALPVERPCGELDIIGCITVAAAGVSIARGGRATCPEGPARAA
mgnify:CR=1 FL=1